MYKYTNRAFSYKHHYHHRYEQETKSDEQLQGLDMTLHFRYRDINNTESNSKIKIT